jgi:hypothetical protein
MSETLLGQSLEDENRGNCLEGKLRDAETGESYASAVSTTSALSGLDFVFLYVSVSLR